MTIEQLLTQQTQLLYKLTERLAPVKQQSTPIIFDGLVSVPGYVYPPVQLTQPYNQFVNNITVGTVYIYRNYYNQQAATPQVPDFVINATDNPLPIPMGLLNDTQLIFQVAPGSSGNAKGTFYINRY